MVKFSAKEISNPPRVSERLKETREARGLSLALAGAETGIAVKYLAALEAGEFNKLPGEVYGRSFLKVYARYLGLNFSELMSAFATEQKIFTKTQSSSFLDQKNPVKRISRAHLLVTPKIVRGAVIALLALACLVYLGVKISRIASPPVLVVEQPADQLLTDQSFVTVSGRVDPETILTINGQQVQVDESGQYAETIDLQPGVNLIELKAENRHGRQTKIERRVILNP